MLISCAALFIHDYKALVGYLCFGGFKTQAVGTGASADGNQHPVKALLGLIYRAFQRNAHSIRPLFQGFESRIEVDGLKYLLQPTAQTIDQVEVCTPKKSVASD